MESVKSACLGAAHLVVGRVQNLLGQAIRKVLTLFVAGRLYNPLDGEREAAVWRYGRRHLVHGSAFAHGREPQCGLRVFHGLFQDVH